MAYSAVPTVVTGQTWTAANQNTYVKDNFAAVFPYTTAGDIAYATSASALTRLAVGGLGALLGATATAPAWLTPSTSGAFLICDADEATGLRWVVPQLDTVDTNESSTSTTYTDLATAGPTITLDVGANGIAEIWWGARIAATAASAGGAYVGVGLNGADPGTTYDAVSGITDPDFATSVFGYRKFTGLTPGNNIFKLRYLTTSGSSGGTRFAYRWIRGYSL